MSDTAKRDEIPPGTLYMLILKMLARNSRMHGYEIANAIQQITLDVLQVEEGSLYPALQRMLLKGWVKAAWGVTAGNRRARYYQLTADGRKRLSAEVDQYERVSGAIQKILQMA
ncbi:MAG TPA: PadR family transcriptional regulator [Bryobacteraceae bacterium]